ncbi:MFS transporter [Sphingomonas sp. Leaf17]|uniref:MFS transporter n=1 Tax=Sphingomonas sp. Leaf17 TaxID=1735683 RepID=UPI002286650A|nr:MFS transporter [Sphingomonas sp. Leaf17]
MCLAHLATMASRSAFAAIVPVLGRQYHFTDTALGVLMGPAFAVMYGVAAITFGSWADRHAPRRLMIAGLAVVAVASGIVAISDRFGLFFLGQLLLGLGQAAFVPAAILLIVRDAPRGRTGPPPLALFTGASALGRSTGFMIAGLVLAASLTLGRTTGIDGWRVLPLVMALSIALLAGVCCRTLPRHRAIRPDAPALAPAHATGPVPAALIPLFAAAFAPVLIGQSIAAWMPSLLVRMRGFTPADAATVFGGILLVMGFAGQLVGGLAIQRIAWISRRPLVANAVCLGIALPLLVVATHAPRPVVIGLSLAGVLLVIGMAAFIALQAVQTASPADRRGTTTGVFLALVTLVGAGGGPLLTGLLSDSGLTAADGQGLAAALVLVAAGGAGFNALLAAGIAIRPTTLAAVR